MGVSSERDASLVDALDTSEYDNKPERFRARLAWQQVVGQVGIGVSTNNLATAVTVELDHRGMSITVGPSGSRTGSVIRHILLTNPLGFKKTWKCDYREIELAELVVVPWILNPPRRIRSVTEAVRLRMGPSRVRPVLMLPEAGELLVALERHGVKTDRPLNNVRWVGRD